MRYSATPLELSAAIFDFDGTLIDSGPGILKTVRATAAELGLPSPSEEMLRKFIGPPLIYSFTRTFGMSHAEAEKASRIYRRILAETDAYKDAYFYPGILDVVRGLRTAAVPVAIASAKRTPMIEKTLEYFGVSDLFDAVCGAPAGDEIADKPGNTRRAIEEVGATAEASLLIGDSDYDADAAHKVGVPFCAVLWGYGFATRSDAEAYDPDYIAATVPDFAALVLPPELRDQSFTEN